MTPLLLLFAEFVILSHGARIVQAVRSDGIEVSSAQDPGSAEERESALGCGGIVGAVVSKGSLIRSAGCKCPYEMSVQCFRDDEPARLLGRKVTHDAVKGKSCICVSKESALQGNASEGPVRVSTCSEDVSDCLYRWLPSGVRYWLTNFRKLFGWDLKGNANYDSLPKYYLEASKGHRYEVAYRGSTLVMLSQDAVSKALQDLVNRPAAGEAGTLKVQGHDLNGSIDKRSELGNMAMGNVGQFYKRFGGLGLGAPVGIHDAIRPLVQRLYGTEIGEFQPAAQAGYSGKGDGNFWTDVQLVESAREFLAETRHLNYSTHYCFWAIRQYHEIIGIDKQILSESTLGIADPAKYAQKLCEMQGPIVTASAIPRAAAYMMKWTSSSVTAAIAWRRAVQKDYTKALTKRLKIQDDQLAEDVAAAVMDAHLFAGGLSVPNWIASCIQTLYRKGTHYAMAGGGEGVLDKDFSITDFAWEVSRLMSPVHFVPFWYKNEGGGWFSSEQKVLACTACAQYDPRVWEPDGSTLATAFKIRPTEVYERNSIGWADKAHNELAPERDRWCPGKRLSLSLIVSWLTAFLEVRHKWSLEPGHTWKGQHLSPYVKSFKLIRNDS